MELLPPRLVDELADRGDPRRSRAETSVELVLREAGPSHVAHLGVEVLANRETMRDEAVAIAVEVELGAIAGVVAGKPGRIRLRPIGLHPEVVEEGERAVHAHRVAGVGAAADMRSARG